MALPWERGWLGAASRAEGLCPGTLGATGEPERWLPRMVGAAGGKGQALQFVPLLSLGEVEPHLTVPTGHLQECRRDLCCTIGCKMRRGAQCLSGPCCRKCQVSRVAGADTLHSLGMAPVPASLAYMTNVKRECNGDCVSTQQYWLVR